MRVPIPIFLIALFAAPAFGQASVAELQARIKTLESEKAQLEEEKRLLFQQLVAVRSENEDLKARLAADRAATSAPRDPEVEPEAATGAGDRPDSAVDRRAPRVAMMNKAFSRTCGDVTYTIVTRGPARSRMAYADLYANAAIAEHAAGKTLVAVEISNRGQKIHGHSPLSINFYAKVDGRRLEDVSATETFGPMADMVKAKVFPGERETAMIIFPGEFCISDITEIWVDGLAVLGHDGQLAVVTTVNPDHADEVAARKKAEDTKRARLRARVGGLLRDLLGLERKRSDDRQKERLGLAKGQLELLEQAGESMAVEELERILDLIETDLDALARELD
ncbi:MAG: hypothetical protein H6807_01075 [Planctomycetes bacterium]|nr:hypothetical protein [Planctomycetota bacterium]